MTPRPPDADGAAPVGVVVGYGSVGQLHARLLATRCEAVALVDPRPDLPSHEPTTGIALRGAPSLAALDASGWPWERTVAVIASWGPTHAAVFEELLALGARTVLCEKPFATSVADGEAMAALAEANGVQLGVHLQHRYSGFVEGVRDLADEHGLGPIRLITFDGGARCLVTNGIHYLDLACALLDEAPVRVVSDGVAQRINPRSPDLDLYEGTASWRFPSGARLAISFTNGSSVEERARLYFRDAVLDVDSEFGVELRGRDSEAVAAFPAVTRTGAASRLLHRGQVPGWVGFPGASEQLLDDLVAGRPLRSDPAAALVSLGGCLGALTSARDGVAVSLPLLDGDPRYFERWPVS